MKIVKGAAQQSKKRASIYDFGALRPGDAIDVVSYSGCREMFRRWRQVSGKNWKLVFDGLSPETPGTYRFFVREIKK